MAPRMEKAVPFTALPLAGGIALWLLSVILLLA